MTSNLIFATVAITAVVLVWLLARSRIGRIVLAGFVALGVIVFFGRRAAMQRLREDVPVRELSAMDAAHEVGKGAGSTRIVVVYDPTCGGCREVLPELARFASRRARDGVRLYAFALTDDPDDVRRLLAEDPTAFAGYRVLPYAPGELSAAMSTVNVWVPHSFAPPLVSVLAPDGSRVGAWEGVDELSELGPAVESAIAGRQLSGR